MKKFIKGFTLIELIIVMAIMSILTVAMVQMFKPIRETYVDATLLESRRSAQTGITKYITESIRFSTDLGFYTKNKVSDIKGAVDKFANNYLDAKGVTDATERSNKKIAIERYADVIVIDNTTDAYSYNGNDYTGRLIRRKFVDAGGVPEQISNDYEIITNSDKCRLALGSAYYGGSDYTVQLTLGAAASDGISVSVASTATARTTGKTGGVRDVSEGSSSLVQTPGFVICKNQSAQVGGMYDIADFDSAAATVGNSKVYIVWLDGDAKDIVDATP